MSYRNLEELWNEFFMQFRLANPYIPYLTCQKEASKLWRGYKKEPGFPKNIPAKIQFYKDSMPEPEPISISKNPLEAYGFTVRKVERPKKVSLAEGEGERKPYRGVADANNSVGGAKIGADIFLTEQKLKLLCNCRNHLGSEVEIGWERLKNLLKEKLIMKERYMPYVASYGSESQLILRNQGAKIYNDLQELVKFYLEEKALPLLLASADSETHFLKVLCESEKNLEEAMTMIRDVLSLLEKVYTCPNNLDDIITMGSVSFRSMIIDNDVIRRSITTGLLKSVETERAGGFVDLTVMDQVREMLLIRGKRSLFMDLLERSYVEHAANYYKKNRNLDWIAGDQNPLSYLEKVEKAADEEYDRACFYVDRQTASRAQAVVEESLVCNLEICRKLVEVESTGVVSLLRKQKKEDLVRLLSFVSRVDGALKIVADCISSYLKNQAKNDGVKVFDILSMLFVLEDCFDVSPIFEFMFG